MISLPVSKELHEFLIENGFKANGYDYWLSFVVTDMENEWEEEVYVSRKSTHFEVWYPQDEKWNRKYKTERGLLKYLKQEHSKLF